MNWNRIVILALFDLRHSLFKLKGLVFLIPFFFFWYWVFRFLLEKGGEMLVSPQNIALLSLLYEPETAQVLLVLHPPTLSMFFILMLGSLPLFVMLAGNDQLATDSGRQTFRYFLTRCTRLEIFIGRFISSYCLVSAGIILTGVIAALISLQIDPQGTAETIRYALQVTALCLLYLLPLTAFMAAVSAIMSSGMSSLLMAAIIYVSLLLLGSYIRAKTGMDAGLVPGDIKTWLFDIRQNDLLFAVIMLLLYTTIYAGTGWLLFRKRNI